MGFLDRAAAKSEAKHMAMLKEVLDETPLVYGLLDLPCHILPGEVHHGIWIGEQSQADGGWLGLFRCQGHYWGVGLHKSERDQAVRDPEALVSWKLIGQMQGTYDPLDLGTVEPGFGGILGVLLGLEYERMKP